MGGSGDTCMHVCISDAVFFPCNFTQSNIITEEAPEEMDSRSLEEEEEEEEEDEVEAEEGDGEEEEQGEDAVEEEGSPHPAHNKIQVRFSETRAKNTTLLNTQQDSIAWDFHAL